MIGSAADARRALEGDGLLVGEGNFRSVRRPGDVVYKIDLSSQSLNAQEFWVAEEGRLRLPPNVIVPPITLHDVDGTQVLAMPFIEGEAVGLCPADDAEMDQTCNDCATCLPIDVARAIYAVTPDGITRGNTIRQGNTYVIIDLDYPPDPQSIDSIRR